MSLLCHRLPDEPRLEQRNGVEVRRINMAIRGCSLPIMALPAYPALRAREFDVVMERFDTFGGLGALYSRRGGAASTYFWIDREEELIGLELTQLMPSDTYPLRAEMRIRTYQALIN